MENGGNGLGSFSKLCQVFIGMLFAKDLAASRCKVGMDMDSPVQVMPEDTIPPGYLAVIGVKLRVLIMDRHHKTKKLSAANQMVQICSAVVPTCLAATGFI